MKNMTPAKALTLTKALLYIGALITFAGIAAGIATDTNEWLLRIAIPGIALMVVGRLVCVNLVRCPRCGAYLGKWPKVPGKVPERCPNCGMNPEKAAAK